MVTKDRLHQIIEALLDTELPTAEQTLLPLVDPLTRTLLLAPVDDEPVTVEEQAAIAEAEADIAAGR